MVIGWLIMGMTEPAAGRRGVDPRTALVAAGTALLILILALATTGGAPLLHSPTHDRALPTYRLPSASPTPPAPPPPGAQQPLPDPHLGGFLIWSARVLAALLILAVLALVVRAVHAGLQRRRSRRTPAIHPLGMTAAALAQGVREDAAAQQEALIGGPVSDAIISCWIRLEQSVERAGVIRHPSETSAELSMRVLDGIDVDPVALHDLAALYREARFSRHPMNEAARTQARTALDRIHATLPAVDEPRADLPGGDV